jgi:hypothetical protein
MRLGYRSAARSAVLRSATVTILVSALGVLIPVGAGAQSDAANRIREKVFEFLQAIESSRFETHVKGRDASSERVYATYHYLTTPEKINELRSYKTGASEVDADAYELSARFLVDQTIRSRSAAEVDGGTRYLAETSILVNGEEISLRNVVSRMADEEDRSARRQWSFAFTEFMENANVYLRQAVHLSNQESKKFGYDGYQDFMATYHGFDIDQLQARAQVLIDSTNDAYRQLFESEIAATFEGNLDLASVRYYDVPMVRRMSRFDDVLPAKRAKNAISNLAGSTGFQLGKPWGVDYEAARVPHARDGVDHYLAKIAQSAGIVGHKETSGFLTHAGYLRETGTLLYFGYAGGVNFEHHFLGDPSMAYAAGYLFENLLEDTGFLTRKLDVSAEEADAIREAHRFHRLYEIREYAGRLLFLPDLYTDVKQPQELYESIFEPIRMWSSTQVDRAMYMASNDEFDCAARFKGMLLASALREHLQKRFGDEWWSLKDVAGALKTLWGEGQRITAEEFGAKLDVAEITPSLLLTDLRVVETP